MSENENYRLEGKLIRRTSGGELQISNLYRNAPGKRPTWFARRVWTAQESTRVPSEADWAYARTLTGVR